MSLSNPYSPYLFFSAIIAVATAFLTWRRRSAPGAIPLLLMLITMAIWAGSNGMVFETKDPALQLFWFNMLTFGAIMGSPAFWAFGIEFTNHGHLLTLRNILLISVIPVVSVILGWTTEQHGLFYAVRDLTTKLPNGDWNFTPGPFYWVYITYSYLLTFFTLAIIFRAYLKSPPATRRQSATILLGTLIPLLGNIGYNLIIGTGKGAIDPTPLLFTAMGCVYAFGLFRYGLFDIIPVARHVLVDHMQDGVIVIDNQNRIVDANPSALRWLDWKQSVPVGKDLRELLGTWFEQLANFPLDMYVETEVNKLSDPNTYFDLRIEPLRDGANKSTGRLIVFRDVTRQKKVERALRDAHDKLRLHVQEIEILQAELREQAIRDPLTGLFNRRYMEETLERELARAIREETSIGICMADIDDFKSFNDKHGHDAGDIFLKAIAEILLSYSRAEDVVCRYGGEEFLILMPGADLDTTSRRAEDWRRAFEQTRIEYKGKTLSTTLSIGVAVYPLQGRTGHEVLKLADDAMYISKREGKNKVSMTATRS